MGRTMGFLDKLKAGFAAFNARPPEPPRDLAAVPRVTEVIPESRDMSSRAIIHKLASANQELAHQNGDTMRINADLLRRLDQVALTLDEAVQEKERERASKEAIKAERDALQVELKQLREQAAGNPDDMAALAAVLARIEKSAAEAKAGAAE